MQSAAPSMRVLVRKRRAEQELACRRQLEIGVDARRHQRCVFIEGAVERLVPIGEARVDVAHRRLDVSLVQLEDSIDDRAGS